MPLVVNDSTVRRPLRSHTKGLTLLVGQADLSEKVVVDFQRGRLENEPVVGQDSVHTQDRNDRRARLTVDDQDRPTHRQRLSTPRHLAADQPPSGGRAPTGVNRRSGEHTVRVIKNQHGSTRERRRALGAGLCLQAGPVIIEQSMLAVLHGTIEQRRCADRDVSTLRA